MMARMCGRYSVIKHQQIVRVVFNVTMPANLRLIPRYNLAPSELAPVITAGGELQMMRWGLLPAWIKDPAMAHPHYLARAETLAEKPSFRKAFTSRRCLIMADGF